MRELLFFSVLELEARGGEFEVVEVEVSGEGEAAVWGGDDRARGHGDEGSAGVAGLDLEAMPEGGGDLAEFALGDEVEVEENEREVAVAEEEVGAFEGLFDFGAAEPDEVAALGIAVGGGVEGVAAIDEGEGEVAFFGEEFGDDEGGSGGVVGRDDFAEMAGREFERGLWGGGFLGNGGAMSGRELLAKLPAELVDLQDAQNMFIRTLFYFESRR